MNAKQLRSHKWLILLLAVLLVAGAGITIAAGQTGDGYNLEWNVVSSSGSFSSTASPPHSLGGSAGQPGAGGPMTGGAYSLAGGFWTAVQPLTVYIPAVRK